MDSAESTTTILSTISSKDHVHIEIGIFQKKEIEVLFLMLGANYKHVAVTLHDAPLLKYPFHEFKHPLLNKLSKFYDKYGTRFGAIAPYLKKIKAIYVLSKKGQEAVKKRYGVEHVHYLPHIIDIKEIDTRPKNNNNFIYFGFIGRNKGIEYALQLHEQLLTTHPDLQFYIVGTPIGQEKRFYDYLRMRYKKNTHFLGYVPEEQLAEVFDAAAFALILFKNYRFFWPFSGSILYSLKKGKILLTNKMNTVPEIIEHGKNGFYLTGQLKKDMKAVTKLMHDQPLLHAMKDTVYHYLLENHSAEVVRKQFKD
jgi:glycosyltransferase involved in cell wall biosynthesis